MSGWLEALLGKVLNSGVSIPLSKGLNFTGGLGAALNQATKQIDVTFDPSEVAANFPGAPVYDVRNFGAIGHLSADDTNAINAAIAAANATSGTVWLGAAHRITSALTPVTNNNVMIRGRGRFNGGTIIQDDSPSGCDVFTIRDCQYSGVSDLWITASRAMTTGWGVRVVGCFRPRLDTLLIGNKGSGVEVLRSVLTEINEVQLSDLYGPYGFYVHGDNTNYCHATLMSRCGGGTGFPIGVTGNPGPWVASTAYSVGNLVIANGNIYVAFAGGTSSAVGSGPSGLPNTNVDTVHTTGIVDGTVTWYFAMPAAAWFQHGSYAHTLELNDCGGLQGAYGLRVVDDAPGAGSKPLFTRAVNFSCDHPVLAGIQLDAGAHARFTMTFVTSVLAGPGIVVGPSHGGDWEFNGVEVFGAQKEGVKIQASGGSLRGVDIGAVSYGFNNQFDAIAISNGADKITVSDCATDFLTPSVHRYGLSVAAGSDSIIATGNRLTGLTAPVLNTPGASSTVVVRDNLPDIVAAGRVAGRAIDAGAGTETYLDGPQLGSLIRRYWWLTDSLSSGAVNGYVLAEKDVQISFNLASPASVRSFTVSNGRTIQISLENTSQPLTLENEHGSGTLGLIRTPGAQPLTLYGGDGCELTFFNNRYRVTSVSRYAENGEFMFRFPFTASGATGTLIDVTLWNAAAPFAMRILSAELLVSVAAATASALRTASAGGGSVVLPDAATPTQSFSTASAGRKFDNSSATATLAAAGSLFFRVDRAVTGEILLKCVRT